MERKKKKGIHFRRVAVPSPNILTILDTSLVLLVCTCWFHRDRTGGSISRQREREILCLLHGYIIYAPRSSKSRHWRVTGVTLSSFVHPPPILFSVSSTFWSSYFSIRWIDAPPRDVTRYQYKKNHSRGENRAHGVRAYSNLRIESGLLVV